ncbi:putative subtilisin-like protease-like [Capsicum annuum]|nr:putative subtilisin-like protease-like [Capsicum annuum]
MIFFQEFFVIAMVALVFSCIIVKIVSALVSNDGRIDKERIVVEETKITKGLVVSSRNSKKRVKFVEQEVVGNVDHVVTQRANEDGVEKKIEGILKKGDDFKGEKVIENLGVIKHCGGEKEVSDDHDDVGKIGLMEDIDVKKIEGILKKGDDFKVEKVTENLEVIEHCGDEREVSDVHDDADMCRKIEFVEKKDEVKKIEGVLKKGDDFKVEKVHENLGVIEQCGGEREVSDGHCDADICSTVGLLEEKDEIKKIEEKIEEIIKKGDDFKGEKVRENFDLIEHYGGEREVSDVHGDADMCSEIGLMEEKDEVKKIEKKIEDILKKGDEFKGKKVCENLDLIEHYGGEREVSDVHDDADMCRQIGLMEEKDVVKKIDELLVVKEKDIVNRMIVDEVKLGENEVVEVGGGLSKGDDDKTDMIAMDEYSDDDWEGIERSELEEEFVKAVNFVDGGNGKNSSMENLGSELMMQLYGLQKIAMEGPCHEPQPMALKVYARAKWNAWQKMGSMNPEVAMEQYIKLLSDHVPKWTHHSKDDCEVGSSETKMTRDPDSLNDTHKDERTQEMNHAAEGGDFSGGGKIFDNDISSANGADNFGVS